MRGRLFMKGKKSISVEKKGGCVSVGMHVPPPPPRSLIKPPNTHTLDSIKTTAALRKYTQTEEITTHRHTQIWTTHTRRLEALRQFKVIISSAVCNWKWRARESNALLQGNERRQGLYTHGCFTNM